MNITERWVRRTTLDRETFKERLMEKRIMWLTKAFRKNRKNHKPLDLSILEDWLKENGIAYSPYYYDDHTYIREEGYSFEVNDLNVCCCNDDGRKGFGFPSVYTILYINGTELSVHNWDKGDLMNLITNFRDISKQWQIEDRVVDEVFNKREIKG